MHQITKSETLREMKTEVEKGQEQGNKKTVWKYRMCYSGSTSIPSERISWVQTALCQCMLNCCGLDSTWESFNFSGSRLGGFLLVWHCLLRKQNVIGKEQKMPEKAFHQHSSRHQGTISVAAQPVHLMHTPGACKYPCTTMDKKNHQGSAVWFLPCFWPPLFQIKLMNLFILLSLLSCKTEVFAQQEMLKKAHK